MRVGRTAWVTGGVFVAALVVAGLIGGPEARPTVPGAARAQVRVVPLVRTRLPGEVRAGGFLRARADVTVSAERAGRVVALPVAEGAPVAAGAVVARLDDEAAAAHLERARAVARESALDPQSPAAELARAREALRLAEEEVRLRHPVAPLAGVVEVHHVDEGEYVQPGAPLVDVLDLSALLLDVDVDGEVVGALHPGLEVGVAVTALPGAPRTGVIERVASRAGDRTRRFRVEVALDAGDGAVRPGMHAEARFTLPAGEPALYVPKAATRRERGQNGVYVVVDGAARWRPVDVAEVYPRPDLYRVLGGGLAEGELLVVAGFGGLRDGVEVEVLP